MMTKRTFFDDEFCNEGEMARRASVTQIAFHELLMESDTPGEEVSKFIARIRELSSQQGKRALELLSTDSPEYQRFAGWTKQMVMWMNTGAGAQRNLQLDAKSGSDLLTAARVMAGLQVWSEVANYALPPELPKEGEAA